MEKMIVVNGNGVKLNHSQYQDLIKFASAFMDEVGSEVVVRGFFIDARKKGKTIFGRALMV